MKISFKNETTQTYSTQNMKGNSSGIQCQTKLGSTQKKCSEKSIFPTPLATAPLKNEASVSQPIASEWAYQSGS